MSQVTPDLQFTRVTDLHERQLWNEQAVWAGIFGGASVALLLTAFCLPVPWLALPALFLLPVASVAAVVFGLLGARQRWRGYKGRWLAMPGVLIGTVITAVILLEGLLLALFAALDAFLKSINLI